MPSTLVAICRLHAPYSTLYLLGSSLVVSLSSPQNHPSPFLQPQTGNSPPLPNPILSTSTPIQGPTIGMFLANPAIDPRKSPNRMKIPYNSTKKPINAQRMRIRKRPMKNAAVPFNFCLRAKKESVFWGPIIIVRPMRNKIYMERSGRLKRECSE